VYGTGVRSGRMRDEMREKIHSAVRVIENAQTYTGGWGYEPSFSTNHEGSVTVTVVQALRLARDAGFVVDNEVHELGLKYLKESQKPDGSFRYSHQRADSTPALTSAALCAMHGFAEYSSKVTRAAMDYLRVRYRRARPMLWPYYGPYYAAQVFYRSGGEDWENWNRTWVPFILARSDRGADGVVFWDDSDRADRSQGRAYATAFSCLTLSVQDGMLPLFQK